MLKMFAGDDHPEASFCQCTEGSLLFSGEALHPFEEVVGNFDGGLHYMPSHIATTGCPYQQTFLSGTADEMRTQQRKNWRPACAGRQNQTQGVEVRYADGTAPG